MREVKPKRYREPLLSDKNIRRSNGRACGDGSGAWILAVAYFLSELVSCFVIMKLATVGGRALVSERLEGGAEERPAPNHYPCSRCGGIGLPMALLA